MSKLIVALDYTDVDRAEDIVNDLGDSIDFYKVGLELFLNSRGLFLDFLKKKNKKIFLDLKFHDIPNTVAQAAKWAAELEVEMFNVHASGGRQMQKMTVDAVNYEAVKNGVKPPLLIAVTVLTSFDEENFADLGFKKPINESALQLAKISQETGMDGVVCSALESLSMKNAFGNDFLTVCPGVRPLWSASQDQKRIVTPKQAKENLADYIVVGRPITASEEPVKAALRILDELNN